MTSATSECWIWEQDGRFVVRVRTNLGRQALLARIARFGLEGSVVAPDAHPDATRVCGGTYYDILWQEGVGIEVIRQLLARL